MLWACSGLAAVAGGGDQKGPEGAAAADEA